jgi:serine/threonine protein kinase
VTRWAIDLLGGLAEIHRNGFIHRDIKPANVMILGPAPEPGVSPEETAAKLLDFGAVKPTDDGPRTSGRRRLFIGTREYAPPEQWDERVVPASDLYALGATLYHALTGRPPYEVEDRDAVAFRKAHARAPIPNVRDFAPDVPESLDRLIQRMLAKAAEDRGTAVELLDKFHAFAPSATHPAPSPALPPVPPPTRTSRRPNPVPAEEKEMKNPGVVDSFLTVLERVFLPDHLRPVSGHEPAASERFVALLRRPLVLVTLLVLLGLLIFLVM